MAHCLREDQGQDVAEAVCSASLLLMGPAFSAAHFYLERDGDLIADSISVAERRRRITRSVSGQLASVAAVALACVNAYAGLDLCVLVAAYHIPAGAPRRAES